jgi:hypothetical protein
MHSLLACSLLSSVSQSFILKLSLHTLHRVRLDIDYEFSHEHPVPAGPA